MSRPTGHPLPSTAATAAGVDHVLLSYRYLDDGDLDAYGSLFADDAQVNHPGVPHGQGRRRLLDLHAPLAGPSSRHHVYKVVAQGDAVAVMGRLTRRSPAPPVDFADFFTLSDDGLLLGYRRFYFTPPPL
ncbi:nuclear transport factor 2 family protein [Actinocorallia sp. B10E7]|uniref:nuclear transport factor 2 family protein n=1 Tax=Actinocorallia sp. B10E7 TaxID=3153558 RepID=UPI00325D8447